MLSDKEIINLLNNALIKYEKGQYVKPLRFQIAGFIEGVLTSIGKIDANKPLEYQYIEKKGFFRKKYLEPTETYPELMVRLANETIKNFN